MAYASGVGSGSIISGDFVNPMPPMLVGLLITGSGIRFLLPRAGVPLPDMAFEVVARSGEPKRFVGV